MRRRINLVWKYEFRACGPTYLPNLGGGGLHSQGKMQPCPPAGTSPSMGEAGKGVGPSAESFRTSR